VYSFVFFLRRCLPLLNFHLRILLLSRTDRIIQMDHIQYKDAERPPHGTPDDIRPFLLSRHQLKSFNSDYLRSALRKTKVNKSFCVILRSPDHVIRGVPPELQRLGNEAFARSIRTHQIIAFFMRYYSLYNTKYPGRVLDLERVEHRLLLDCLRDIVRRVSAKRVIQRAVVEQHDSGNGGGGSATNHGGRTVAESPLRLSSYNPGLVDAAVDLDEKENKGGDYHRRSIASHGGAADADLSFDSTTTTGTVTTTSSSITSPGVDGSGGGETTARYNDVLALLSTDARQAVEAMVERLRREVHEESRHEVCRRSFEEGRRVGRMEGRVAGFGEGVSSLSSAPSSSSPAGAATDK